MSMAKRCCSICKIAWPSAPAAHARRPIRTQPRPSSLGLSDDAVRSSLRFGLGRFNTAEEVEAAIEVVADSVNRLRKLSSMA